MHATVLAPLLALVSLVAGTAPHAPCSASDPPTICANNIVYRCDPRSRVWQLTHGTCQSSTTLPLRRRGDDGSWKPEKYDKKPPGGKSAGYDLGDSTPAPAPAADPPPSPPPGDQAGGAKPAAAEEDEWEYEDDNGAEGGGGGGGGGSSSGAMCSKGELQEAIKVCGYPTAVTDEMYKGFKKSIAHAGITTKAELAMFLAQVLWESGGLAHKAELKCKENKCAGEYRHPGDPKDKFYYGRGYIQLTWSYNYKKCSHDLFKDNRLYNHPNSVQKSEELSWATAAWFWRHQVHPKIKEHKFGFTTQYINGALECRRWRCERRHGKKIEGLLPGPNSDKATKRFKNYEKIFRALKVPGKPHGGGCLFDVPHEFRKKP